MNRTLDAEAFNIIAADPEVRPWLGLPDPTEPVDFSSITQNTDNFCLLTRERDGGYMLIKLQPGLYVAHTLALPSARGRPMLRLMREGFAFMFSATDCIEIVTQVPDQNEAAQRWSDLAGFRNVFRREACFSLMGELVGCQFRSLTYQDWAIRHQPNQTLGHEFHEVLKAAGLADHADDPVHDAFVGATIACVQNQNIHKGLGMYARWAMTANYVPARLITASPPTIDTGEAVVQLLDGQLSVLSVNVAARSAPLDS